ncbi:MAG: hypothetical protein KJ057_02735 [Phycisphaerae bacterium]|nr:MAG: hypothetical protein EDS66_01600 [Planctomycetota bacterium]KAB2944461.1 MAG: hypothetical protein F9K17_11265 [Phycisphaerae bacterium]MBE7457566.1 hypothetical protein [Planctomycetia bacterium]MCK6464604.1 hypothetical protein [Phycisphaerae bacterium]MCL4717368.1 hypothetical protein [Phycisphaerae bacterium]
MIRITIFGALMLLAILHQDFWWRDDHRTLVFGFLPVSLAYHIGVSIAACLLWGLACRYCWPRDLEVADSDAETYTPHGGRP